MDDNTVVVSNALNRAAHKLTLAEKRVVMFAVSKLGRVEGNPAIELKASELMQQYNLDKKNTYGELRKACKGIMRKPPISVQESGFLREINWAEYCDYYESEARVVIQFTAKVAPHITALVSHFTQYKLSRVTGFKSGYSWKLFELIMQFKQTGIFRISVDDFADAMDAAATHRKDFGAMRRRVIEPAIKEIREKDGLEVEYNTTKRGRKVSGLEFTFPVEQQEKLPLPAKKSAASKPQGKPPLSTAGAKKAEQAAELAHLERLANLAGVPIETLTKKEKSPA